MTYGPITNGIGSASLSIKDIDEAMKKIRGLPPTRWLLMAPDGTTWAYKDPADLVLVLMKHMGAPMQVFEEQKRKKP